MRMRGRMARADRAAGGRRWRLRRVRTGRVRPGWRPRRFRVRRPHAKRADPRAPVDDLRRLAVRLGAVLADGPADRQARVLPAALHVHARRPAEDSRRLERRLEDQLRLQLQRQPLRFAARHLLHGTDVRRAGGGLLVAQYADHRSRDRAALSRQSDSRFAHRSFGGIAARVHPGGEPAGRASELSLHVRECRQQRRCEPAHHARVRPEQPAAAAGRAAARRTRRRWTRRWRASRHEPERRDPLPPRGLRSDDGLLHARRRISRVLVGRARGPHVRARQLLPHDPPAVQSQPQRHPQPLRGRHQRHRRCGHRGRLDRPVRLGRAVAVVHHDQQPPGHHAFKPSRSHDRAQLLGGDDTPSPHAPRRRRCPIPCDRQPARSQRQRQLHVHRDLHGRTRRHGARLRGLPAGASPGGDAAIRAGHRALPRAHHGPVLPGRLAAERHPHAQPRRPVPGTSRPTRSSRTASSRSTSTRTSPRPCRSNQAARGRSPASSPRRS